ncbi:PREDICTED: uncharacterized protein LOC107185721 [Dufourea novaeangliae]|uniref:DUF4812 domain-containing protein n=1 Tax=Dufourea novaeangliae TaxID=178035 RepID=A0A154P6F3_DUFNO|nr:PREDICTED: uncharacterized protein LOC107185721 [Dufourea novaeangliae]KZC07442.1 hypothetical protein WN55_09434 [Dufourea novaeangliae]
MKSQKCCAHCPGMKIRPETNESHECCQPKYVSGNIRVPSLTNHVTDYPATQKRNDHPKPPTEDRPSCYDHFAMAKKLHAENLEHQPLPDKVDDSVFKNVTLKRPCRRYLDGKRCSCCSQETDEIAGKSTKQYRSILGCKEPKTKMDLAICWDTPVDPVYESPRATHIDGSEGGQAPAIFTLVQRSLSSPNCIRSSGNNEDCYRPSHSQNDDHERRSCYDCSCKNLNGMKISKKDRPEERTRSATFRKCVACEQRNFKDDPRQTKSAVGLALGVERRGNDQERRTAVSRPKTPFARRSFSIDTLVPPLSVMKGQRDADYPEHWRLMSVYQQSYRNPYRRRDYRC